MYKIIKGKTHGLKDVEDFIEILNTLDQNADPHLRSLFDRGKKIVISRAPGRLDVMGGIADYSGSLVLQLPIKEATFAAIQKSSDRTIKIASLNSHESGRQNYFEMPLDDFFNNRSTIEYKSTQKYFKREQSTQWAAYAAGAIPVLIKEKGIRFDQGANILIHSQVPEGMGVSSSAALEVAAMSAICGAFDIPLQPRELAVLCQKVENLVVGAPCGIMDQMTSVLGRANQLMALLCQPAQLEPFIAVPEEISFWGIDSGIRHSVAGSSYTSVRIGTFMGQRIISELKREQTGSSSPQATGKYLADITPTLYEQQFAAHLPEKMKGREFIRKYHSTIDEVTKIDPDFIYSVRRPAEHPIYENSRVRAFASMLKGALSKANCRKLGELMYQSHHSYSACGLGSSGTDRLVGLTRELGAANGLYGAKITGGGSGGTVVILGRRSAAHLIEEIAGRYSKETAHHPHIFSGSSMGAAAFGHIELTGA
jgi:galactokinase